MKKELIFIGSVNKAMRARDILKDYGITAYVERGSDSLNSRGCGFSILIIDSSRTRAEEILKENGIQIPSAEDGN